MADSVLCWRLLLALALFATLQLLAQGGGIDWQWRVGRATQYGGPQDPWTIHYGSCGYYYLDPTVNKGWDVAALPDAVDDYAGSCGRCYEIACNPAHISDGYGTGLDRTNVCYDAGKSVTVMITDSCACNYPPNYYSNKRWCCADYYHFDMSAWAFEKLADKKYGVIGVKYRQVPCDHCPENPAQLPEGAYPSRPVQDAPSGWDASQDKRPYGKMCFKSSLERPDQGSSGSGSNNQGQDQQQQDNQQQQQQGSSDSSSGGQAGFSSVFGSGSLFSGWQDKSYSLGSTWSDQGPDSSSANCGSLGGNGAVLFQGSTGSMVGKKQLNFNTKVDGSGQLPDIMVSMASSSKGSCRSIDLRSISGGQRSGDWVQVTIPLINLDWSTSSWQSNPTDFNGCSSSLGAWDVDQIEFKNKWGGDQGLCLSDVKAY